MNVQEIAWNSNPEYRGHRRRAIIAAFVISILAGPFIMALEEGSNEVRVLNLVLGLVGSLVILAGVYFDSLLHGIETSRALRLMVVLLGIVGLVIYLLRTRGFRRGFVSSAKALSLLFVMSLVAFISGVVCDLIFEFS